MKIKKNNISTCNNIKPLNLEDIEQMLEVKIKKKQHKKNAIKNLWNY